MRWTVRALRYSYQGSEALLGVRFVDYTQGFLFYPVTRSRAGASRRNKELRIVNLGDTPKPPPTTLDLTPLIEFAIAGYVDPVVFRGFMRVVVSFAFLSEVAYEFGAIECCWRESSRSFTGFVAECWFPSLSLAGSFASRAAGAVGVSVRVRCPRELEQQFFVSVPCGR